jgi:hypothetical protein
MFQEVDYEPFSEKEPSSGNMVPTTTVEEPPQIGELTDATATRALQEQAQQEPTEARLKARLTRDKIKAEAIREYKNSREYKTDEETRVTVRVSVILNLAKESKLQQRQVLKTKLPVESAILNPILQSPLAQERFTDINKGISSKPDYLTYEKFIEVDIHVQLWDCRGSMADICCEAMW